MRRAFFDKFFLFNLSILRFCRFNSAEVSFGSFFVTSGLTSADDSLDASSDSVGDRFPWFASPSASASFSVSFISGTNADSFDFFFANDFSFFLSLAVWRPPIVEDEEGNLDDDALGAVEENVDVEEADDEDNVDDSNPVAASTEAPIGGTSAATALSFSFFGARVG